MIGRANSLTARVTKPAVNSQDSWSMPANDVRAFLRAFGCLGYNVETLLASTRLRDAELDDPDARISCEVLGEVLSRAQQERFTPNLALELARVTPLGAYPLLDYLVLTSDSVGDGVHCLARYLRLVGNPIAMEFEEDGDPVRVRMAGSVAPFSIEFVTSLMMLHFGTETDGFAPAHVTFQHQPDDAAAFERALCCPIQTLTPSNSVSIPRKVWRLPLRRRDPVLQQMLERQAGDVLARLPVRTGLATEVQRMLARRVAGGDTGIEGIARQLAMSPRTLQRKLAAEDVSYQELREDARKEAAGRYMSDSTLAICEIAYLVGYSEPAPFHRAFKRWYGMTPEHFRRTHHYPRNR